MDRMTLILSIIAFNSAVSRLLREDVRWFPTLIAPYRDILIILSTMVIGPAFDAAANGAAVGAALLTGLMAALPNIVRLISGLFTSRSPTVRIQMFPVSAVLFVSCLAFFGAQGCAGSFEEARLVSKTPAAVKARAAQPSDYCSGLDSKQMLWHGVAAGAGALSGASGLASIPVEGDARTGLVAGSVALAAVGATAVIIADGASTAWVRDCSQPPPVPQPEGAK